MAFHLRKLLRNLEFDTAAFENLAWWIETDRKTARRIVRLIRETQRAPFAGTGKPEPLKARVCRLLVTAYRSGTQVNLSSI